MKLDDRISALFPALAAFLILAGPTHAQSVTLQPSPVSGASGSEVEVPITISGSKKAGPMQFILLYDPEILKAIADPPGVEARGVVFGEVVENGGMLEQSIIAPGELYIRFVTEDPVNRDGELLKVRFQVTGKNGDSCALSLDAPEVWEKETLNELRVNTAPGTFTVGGAGGLPLPLPLLVAIAAGILLLLLIILSAKKRSVAPKPDAAPEPPRKPATQPAPGMVTEPAPPTDAIERMKQLKGMLDSELISQEEYDAKKQEILGDM